MSSTRERSGGQRHLDDRQAVVEILAERALVRAEGERAVRRRDDAHVDRALRVAADAADRARLDAPGGAWTGRSRGISPISSRKSVPPWASSKTPRRSLTAPLNAPRTCPKSSVSIRFSGMAPQSTGTKGPEARDDAACSERAATSLPVPVSPAMSSVAFVDAMRSRMAYTCRISRLAPTSSPKPSWSEIGTTEFPSIDSIRNTLRPTRTARAGSHLALANVDALDVGAVRAAAILDGDAARLNADLAMNAGDREVRESEQVAPRGAPHPGQAVLDAHATSREKGRR